ncbi:MAG: amidohydrolase [Firmicutes bacterium]|nr:amidohydrolase [Bacillota bacterium]
MDKDIFEKAVELRHEIHKYPDLSNEERPTLERVMKFLKENTSSIEIHDAGHYVWCAYRSPNPVKPNMAFRADCDALKAQDIIDKPYRSVYPGKGHKCGHDGHTAALAGLVLSVDRYGADRDVFFIFQPAEENGSGAKSCLDFITDNNIQEIFAAHGHGKYYPEAIASKRGTIQCASKGMIVEMIGKQAHSATPQDGINPSLALCRLAEYSQEVLKDPAFRSFILATIVQVDIGEHEAFGMSASHGRLLLTIRAEDEAELDELQAKMEAKAKELADAEGLQLRFEYRDEFPMTRNHDSSYEKLLKAVEACGYPFYEVPEPRRGSEDMGHFLKATKGCHYYCSFGLDYPAIHTETYDFRDDGIETIVNVNMALIAGE